MPKSDEINKLPSLIEDFLKTKKKRTSITGSKIIEQRLRKIGNLAPNKRPIDLARLVLIKEGSTVPQALRSIKGLKLDLHGIATAGYTDGWCQSGWNQGPGWGDTWGECWDNSTKIGRINENILVVNSIRNKVQAFSLSEFNQDELKAISNLGIFG